MFKFASRGARYIAAGSLQRLAVIRPASKTLNVVDTGFGVAGGLNFTRAYMNPLIIGGGRHHGLFSAVQKCNCGCGSTRSAHDSKDKQLIEFLVGEIAEEQKAHSNPKFAKFDGFKVVNDGAIITLTKKLGNQNIKVTLNVNHTVDADLSENAISQDKVNLSEMRSTPSFTVEVEEGGQTLCFACSIMNSDEQRLTEEADPDAYEDVFQMDEVTLYKGEREESTYAASGDIMDGYLYDLFMDFLESRGISNHFAEELIDYSTSHEHTLYINLLENIKSFVAK